MPIKLKDINELKALLNAEEDETEKADEARTVADEYRRERLALERQKQEHKQRQDEERLAILKAKEERARRQETAAEEKAKGQNNIYIFSLIVSAVSVFLTFLLLLIILKKF